MADINTLFKNAKFFNEETSTIYEVMGEAAVLPILATPLCYCAVCG